MEVDRAVRVQGTVGDVRQQLVSEAPSSRQSQLQTVRDKKPNDAAIAMAADTATAAAAVGVLFDLLCALKEVHVLGQKSLAVDRLP